MDFDTLFAMIPGTPQTKATIAFGLGALYFLACIARGFFPADSIGGKVCSFVIDGLKPKTAKTLEIVPQPKPDTPKGFVTVRLMLAAAALSAALGYGIARGDDTQPTGIIPAAQAPAGTAPFAPFGLGKGFKLDPFAGLGGTVWDIAHGSVARSYQLGLGLELRKDGIPVGLAASGNLQLGDIVAGSATGGVTLADARFGIFQDLGLGVNVAVASKVASWGPSIFRIFRFSGL